MSATAADLNGREYLVSYGRLGDFGRFRSEAPLELGRGDRAVGRSPGGRGGGAVLGAAVASPAQLLPGNPLGPLLRPAGPDDERAEAEMAARAGRLFERARLLAAEQGLPLEVLDVEV